jgi:hypothetical protein
MISDLEPAYKYVDLDVTLISDWKEDAEDLSDPNKAEGIGTILCSDVIGPHGELLNNYDYAPDNIVINRQDKELLGVFNKDVVVITTLSDANIGYINEFIDIRAAQGRNVELCMLQGRGTKNNIEEQSKLKIDAFII